MKMLTAAVFVVLLTLGARLEARGLPKPISSVERQKVFTSTHSVRGPSQRLPEPMQIGANDRYRPSQQSHGVRGQ